MGPREAHLRTLDGHSERGVDSDGKLTKAGRHICADRHPIVGQVLMLLLWGAIWSGWSLFWIDALTEPPDGSTVGGVLAAIIGLAGWALLAPAIWRSVQDAMEKRAYYSTEMIEWARAPVPERGTRLESAQSMDALAHGAAQIGKGLVKGLFG